jgi:tetratricopeptide (TPR) repeat protein
VGAVLQKVRQGDFPRPREVKPAVPAALEAVCLKAMALRPEDRYPTPRDLAGDIERWLADEPVGAWREPLRLRAGRWARRHQRLVAAAAAAVLVAVLAGGAGAWWLDRQAAERRQAVEAALAEVGRLQGEARWAEARAVLDQADSRLGAGGPADLRARLGRARAGLDLVARLDGVRLRKATIVEGRPDFPGADRGYAAALAEAGMGRVGDDPDAVARRLADSGVREALVAALDDWAATTPEDGRRAWVLGLARRLDPDPRRDRLRDPAAWQGAVRLARLAAGPGVREQPPELVVALGMRLRDLGGQAEGLLRAAQERQPGDFWANFSLGIALADVKPEEAVGYFRASLAVRPRTGAVYTNLGSVLADHGRAAEAAAAYRRALTCDSTLALPHNNLGNLLRARGKAAEAAAAYRRAIALDPRYAPAHYNLGLLLKARGKVAEAAAEYRRAIRLDPNYAAAHSGLGNALREQGRAAEAEAEYRRAIRLDPKLAHAHNGLGNVLGARGRAAEAEAAYRRAIALDSKFAAAHSGLGNVLRAQGRWAEAASEYRRALALHPKVAGAHSDLGNALLALGKRQEAASAYRRALALDPNSANFHYNLGNVLCGQGKAAEAAAEFGRAIELDPGNAPAHCNLGTLLYLQGKAAEAEAAYRRAIRLDPKLAHAHNGLGIVLGARGKAAEAAAAYRRALELDPRDAGPPFNWGNLPSNRDRLAEAEAEYRAALRLQENYPEAHCNLGLVLQAQGKLREALAELRRGHELGSRRGPGWPYRSAAWVQQCERLLALDRRRQAVLRGEGQPAGAAEQLLLARLCHLGQRYADAGRLYAGAFASRPALAGDRGTSHRYNAARAAALAADGRGEEGGRLPDKERAHWRKQARDWLRADLDAWARVLREGTPPGRPAAQKMLRHWQRDPDLTPVRDPAALGRLAPAERAAWQRLWADVAALLDKASGKGAPGK